MGIGGMAKLTNSQPICNDHAIPPNSHPKVYTHYPGRHDQKKEKPMLDPNLNTTA
jgi:hypothetical protein